MKKELVGLHRFLAEPGLESAILGEGNASARDGAVFYVKGSGRSMATLAVDGLSTVHVAPVVEALDGPEMSDDAVREFLTEVSEGPRPSVETFLHAALLDEIGVDWVGHGHPIALLGILCTERAEEEAGRRYFPDEIVCCGPSSPLVPYLDPGLPLARGVRDAVRRHAEEWGEPPRTIWLANHGLIALGASRGQVEAAFAMAVKAARVRLAGAERPLTRAEVERIHTRPDEHHRQRALGLRT